MTKSEVYLSNLRKISNALYFNKLAETDLMEADNSDLQFFKNLTQEERNFIDQDALDVFNSFFSNVSDNITEKFFKIIDYFIDNFFKLNYEYKKCSITRDYVFYQLKLNAPNENIFFTKEELKFYQDLDFISEFDPTEWNNFCLFKKSNILDYFLKYYLKYENHDVNKAKLFAIFCFILDSADKEKITSENILEFHLSSKAYDKGHGYGYLNLYFEFKDWAEKMNQKFPELDLGNSIFSYFRSDF